MFRGISNATLDAKGRLALPVRLRETVAAVADGKVVVTIDMREPCLLLYPLPHWEVVQAKLESLSNIQPDARLLQRLLIGHATDMELDANGRVRLPSMLQRYADFEKSVVIVGQGNKLELWDEENWRSRMSQWLSDESSDMLTNADAYTGLSV